MPVKDGFTAAEQLRKIPSEQNTYRDVDQLR